MKVENEFTFVDVSAENVSEVGICCSKDKKSPGFIAKAEWFKSSLNKGLRMKIALDNKGRQIAFVEYLPSELAWRPVKADNYLFIHCITVYSKDSREKGLGSKLLQMVEEEAVAQGKSGICAMSSDGSWIADKKLFQKNNFTITSEMGRFEMLVKKLDPLAPLPVFIDWTKKLPEYKGWHLIYADQCPWHYKSVTDLQQAAIDIGIILTITKLTTPAEAQQAPSGFGTFSLIKDGKLLADHYISHTRFENILRQELKQV
jgi:L-amino acid N-acyltransferase YncA